MAREQRSYDHEFKIRAVKQAREIGTEKAASKLGVPKGTLSGWLKAVREGRLDAGPGMYAPETVPRLEREVSELRRRSEELEREKQRLLEEKARLSGVSKLPDGCDDAGSGSRS